MKRNIISIFLLTMISIFVLHISNQGQIIDSVSSGRNDAKTPEAAESERKVTELVSKASVSFKQGLLNMQDNRRSQAGEDFNQAVETFLMSGVNVSRNPKLQNCYNQLIETIYRIEFPSNAQQPQIRSLSATCGWSWNEQDYKTADAVAKLVLTTPAEKAPANSLITSTSIVKTKMPTQGYNEQKFEVSPLDELAKLEVVPGKIVIPKPDVPKTTFSRPLLPAINLTVSVRVVKAKSGDTLTKLAAREGVSAVELAKYNGLLPTSILSIGREIKIPTTSQSRQNNARTGNTSTTDFCTGQNVVTRVLSAS